MKYFLLFFSVLSFYSCTSMKNCDKPKLSDQNEGYFFKTNDGTNLFIYNYQPEERYSATIIIISGITGINHQTEKDIIEQLSNNENRIVVIHPRGTGYSDGKRGDISKFGLFLEDYRETIMNDKDYISKQHPIYLYGHSMSTAVLLAIAENLKNIAGCILVNPPYIQKAAKGMTPSFSQYVKYASYMIFAKHKPIVNMAGDPSIIENEEDRKESEQRLNDTLLVKYFSMYYMNEIRKLLNEMPNYSKKADYPLLLVYGLKDNIVDKKGCDIIYNNWNCQNKKYILVENGTHGKSTVKKSINEITEWIKSQSSSK